MSGEVEVSVLVLTYNQATFIARAIESILAQRCDFAFEIIIGEDASTDSTRSVCESFTERYPDIVRLMPAAQNKGVVDNYFDCFIAARGRYITDCAGDDFWPDTERLQKQRDYLRDHPEDVAVMSAWTIEKGGALMYSANMRAFRRYCHRLTGDEMLRNTLGTVDSFPLLSAMMFRRDALMAAYTHNPQALRRREWKCEDISVIAALAVIGSFGYLPLNASQYSVSESSVSNSDSCGHQFDFYIGPAKAVAWLADFYGVAPQCLKPAFDARLKYLASMAWQAPTRERVEALRELCRIWPVRVPLKVRLRLFGLCRY